MELQTLEWEQFSLKSCHLSRDTIITTVVRFGPFADLIAATSSTDQEDWEFLQLSDWFCLISDPIYDTAPCPTTIDVSCQFGCFFCH